MVGLFVKQTIVKPACPLRKKRFVGTHALRLSGAKNLHFAIAPLESRSYGTSRAVSRRTVREPRNWQLS